MEIVERKSKAFTHKPATEKIKTFKIKMQKSEAENEDFKDEIIEKYNCS